MSQVTVEQALRTAIQHHQGGRLPQAEALYRQILAHNPNHADALHLLGILASQVQRNDQAVELIRRAIALGLNSAEAQCNFGNALREIGDLDGSIAACHKAIAIKPNLPEAHSNLGVALFRKREFDAAIAAYRQAIALRPGLPEAHYNLGNVLTETGDLEAAIAAYRRAIALRPHYPEALGNLGNALKQKGEFAAAIAACRQAIALKPDMPEAHGNLGNALFESRDFDSAIVAYRQALALRPNFPDARGNIGVALQHKGQFDEAIDCYHQSLALRPDSPEVLRNLGVAFTEIGRMDEAIECLRKAIALKPDYAEAHSYLLLFLNCLADSTPEDILRESRQWAMRHAVPLGHAIPPHLNDRNPDRRLRIGYVSRDFREHAVGRFLLLLLANIDRGSFETFCYADVRAPDAMTRRLAVHADGWHNIAGLTDQQAADLIRKDQIDVLVDLGLHTERNRLLVFARKPAPVQVTYLAYCSTSGMSAMDYRITDPFLDPPGVNDSYYSEQSIHLPQSYWCYPPGLEVNEPNPLPALSAGHITFGSLNNFSKVTLPTLETWRRLLGAVPQSELIVHAGQGKHRRRLQDFMSDGGIDPRRLRFADSVPIAQYFARYRSIDIGLDPFPYPGGTTTCDALWMGVPVVSLAGRSAVSRSGLSILSNVGRPQWVARDAQEYVNIAVELASDLPRLAELRAALRGRMQASPLMDAPRYARSIESAYRTMWQRWCSKMGE